jgi:dihydroorotase
LIREAKENRINVTAEVTPHHLYFTEASLDSLDTNLKMYPPLRAESDRSALIEALREGTIDAVATDHAPHSESEKNVPFVEAPRGVVGLETAAAATWMTLEDPKRFFEVMSVTPAAIAGMDDQGQWPAVGRPANLVVFDPVESWVPDVFSSRSANSPFIGENLRGRVLATVHAGQLTYELVRTHD